MLIFALLLGPGTALSQVQRDGSGSGDTVPPPEREKFVPVDYLAVPWREMRCKVGHDEGRSECHPGTADNYTGFHRLTLFNPNGSIWYRFSVNEREPDYFGRSPKRGFLPLASRDGVVTGIVVLRLIGESPNWYEVETNENTRSLGYISRKDPMWAKASLTFWLTWDPRLFADPDKTTLYDKPSGEPIADLEGQRHHQLWFSKVDGDWALVRGFKSNLKPYEGWLRWRSGRHVLVGCNLNKFKIPE